MDILENLGEKVGLGNVDLENIKKQASFFIKDKLKVARLAFTDVTPAQLMTEEATNDDEWGPATKVMASISEASFHVEEYTRIVHVLHGRLALIGKKYWRQFYKTLVLLEYLLTHGPEQMVMEFRTDRYNIEDLTRFNYVDDRLVDRGSVVQKKAKQVLQFLMEDEVLKEERSRAQKISKGILGFGGFSTGSSAATPTRFSVEGFGSTLPSHGSQGLMFDSLSPSFLDTKGNNLDQTFTVYEENNFPHDNMHQQEKVNTSSGRSSSTDWHAFEDDIIRPPSLQSINDFGWADFSSSSPGRSPNTNGASTPISADWYPFEEPVGPSSLQSSTRNRTPNTGGQTPQSTLDSPIHGLSERGPKLITLSAQKNDPQINAGANWSVPSFVKFTLPPPPPPPGGSKVAVKVPRALESVQAVPDLIDMSDEVPSISSDLASLEDQESLSKMAVQPSKVDGIVYLLL